MAGETPSAKNSLEILPLEVWSKIFDELDCPTDLESCFRTCRDWMTFLEPKSAHFLMPKVFPLLVKYLKEEEDVNTSVNNSDLDEDALNDDHFDWEDVDDDDDSVNGSEKDETLIPNPILSTRLVCKFWKYAVDRFLQNHPYHTNIDFPKEEENPDPCEKIDELSLNHYNFDARWVEELENLFEINFPPDCNPILTRYVGYFELLYEGQNLTANLFSRLQSAFTNLLLLHGTHIWHASFVFTFSKSGRTRSRKSVYNLVHRYLSLMPNLKTLNLIFSSAGSSCMTTSLEQLLVTNPLPKLEHLTTLKMNTVPAPIQKGILLRNNHIQKLRLLSDFIAASATTLSNLQMDNIKEFTMNVNSEADLLTLQSLPWHIEQLAISSYFLPLDSNFRAITASHFANNLKHLIVKVFGDEEANKLQGKLKLPTLITFQIRVEYMPLKSIDFLLPTSASLSSLQIEINAEQKSTRSMTTRSMRKEMRIPSSNQVVQFYDYIPRMWESNIWNHFPKLKYLKIVKYNPNHVRDFSYSCCGGEPDENHFENEKYEYTRGDWQNLVKNQSK